MKFQLFVPLAAAVLLTGCLQPPANQGSQGAASDNDQNVLTGGPITGTTLKDLPPAVLETLKRRAPHDEVADIDKTTHNGQVVYEIRFTSDQNPKLFIREDGRLYDADAGSR